MSKANVTVDRLVIFLHCWWFGCEPHSQDPAPPDQLECQHCGELMTYEGLAGITRYEVFKDWIRHWFFRKWLPTKCSDCGKRFGKHFGCIPF